MNPPRVFISYSHDSAAHKEWVLDLASTLRSRGVDAILDQWDLRPGDDLPHFMERNLAEADYVVMVCTENYVDKANTGEGGVGYEKMIVTANLLAQIDNNKAIPIIRQNGTKRVPTFLSTKLYIDFSRDEDVEYSLDDLLRAVLNAPLFEKPPISEARFEPMKGARPDRTADAIKSVMAGVAKCYDNHGRDTFSYASLVKNVPMRRLALDKYFQQAWDDGLVELAFTSASGQFFSITPDGRDYLFEHGIVGD